MSYMGKKPGYHARNIYAGEEYLKRRIAAYKEVKAFSDQLKDVNAKRVAKKAAENREDGEEMGK